MPCLCSWYTLQSKRSGSMLVFTACRIGSWQCMQSTFLSLTCFLCMKSTSVKCDRRFSSLWHWKHRSFFASPDPCTASRWQFWHATCREPTKSLWLKVIVPNLMSFSGALWHFSPQPPIGLMFRPSTAPRKWHRKQVVSVTSMWFPTTIWLWQLVHRSFLPRFMSVRCGLWSNLIPRLKVTVPSSSRLSWHPFRRHDSSLISAYGFELYVRVTYFATWERAWNLRIILSRTSGG